MTIRTILVACVLTTAPLAVQAQCMWGDHAPQEAAISCADGTVWDAEEMACITTATS